MTPNISVNYYGVDIYCRTKIALHFDCFSPNNPNSLAKRFVCYFFVDFFELVTAKTVVPIMTSLTLCRHVGQVISSFVIFAVLVLQLCCCGTYTVALLTGRCELISFNTKTKMVAIWQF